MIIRRKDSGIILNLILISLFLMIDNCNIYFQSME